MCDTWYYLKVKNQEFQKPMVIHKHQRVCALNATVDLIYKVFDYFTEDQL